jgi:uncharacterized YigZ family protein
MNTVKELSKFAETIKKSKFITFLHPITSLDNAKEILDNYKKEYNDATHICYSYILDENTYKYYDDGEPSNSAGKCIYQALKNNKLIYVLCVVIRYFGGIKLGVGGLTHAYSNGAINAINEATIIEYKNKQEYTIEISYNQFDNLTYFLEKKEIAILDKQFLDKIYLSLILDDDSYKELLDNFPNLDITLIK